MTSNRASRIWLVVLTAALMLVAAGHVLPLHDLTVDVDEVWSVWQGLGPPQDILRWLPYDWPPLYYLTLGGWRMVVGMNPIALRYLSVLAFMLGAAAIYRVLAHWAGRKAGLLGMLAFSAQEYALLLSTELRGYALMLALTPLALLLTVRYFECPSAPRRRLARRGAALGVALAALFYVSFTGVMPIALLGLLTLIAFPRRVLRWWLPGLIAGILVAPLVIDKLQLVVNRVGVLQTIDLGSPLEALATLFQIQTGRFALAWAILLGLAIVLLLVRQRPLPRPAIFVLIWAVGMPPLMYVLYPVLGFFHPRYTWWAMPGLALLLGWGLSRLPRLGSDLVAVGLAGILLLPGNLNAMKISQSPLILNMAWLADHLHGGDVVVLDPNNGCGEPEEWAYAAQVYFPQGLPVVARPEESQARVWYVTYDVREAADLQAAVVTGRRAGEFVGPPGCLFRLYEGPPDAEGVPFENGMRFHGWTIVGVNDPYPVFHEGETLRVRLWWTADAPPTADYSVGVHVLNGAGQLLTQSDSAPQLVNGPGETSQWESGTLYVEEREITLPYPLSRTELGLYLVVYQWWDNARIAAPGLDDQTMFRLTPLYVVAW